MHVAVRIAAAAALASSASAFVAQVQHASVLAPAAFPDNFSSVGVGACSLVWDPHGIFVPPHPDEPRSACSKNGVMACALAADSWNCVTVQVAAFCAPHPHATPGLELVEGPVSRNGQAACQWMSAGPSAWGDASN